MKIRAKNLPRKKMLRLCRIFEIVSIVPILDKLVKKLILFKLKECKNCSVGVGFKCLCGKINAKNVSLSDTFFIDYDEINIGEGTGFSFQNMLITSTHNLDDWGEVITKPINIGKNCWITSRCTILPGVTIGDNVVIGTGSVVNKNIPSNCIAKGNPCKVIKENIKITKNKHSK